MANAAEVTATGSMPGRGIPGKLGIMGLRLTVYRYDTTAYRVGRRRIGTVRMYDCVKNMTGKNRSSVMESGYVQRISSDKKILKGDFYES